MKNDEQKIIFVIKSYSDGKLGSFISFYGVLDAKMRKYGWTLPTEIYEKIKEMVKEDKYGKFETDDYWVFVLSPDDFTLHTHQHPLIVIKNDDVIDIDEWWYTPFKHLIANTPNGERSYDLKNWQNTGELYDNVEMQNLIRFKTNPDSEDWIYAIRTANLSFE